MYQSGKKRRKHLLASLVLGTFTKAKLLNFNSLVFSFLKCSANVPLFIKTKWKKRHGKKKKKAPNLKIQRFRCLKIVV